MSGQPKKCPHCGETNNPDFTKCWKCQADLTLPVDPLKIEQSVKANKDKWWRVCIRIVAAQFAFVGLILVAVMATQLVNPTFLADESKKKAVEISILGLGQNVSLLLWVAYGVMQFVSAIGLWFYKKWAHGFVLLFAAINLASHLQPFDQSRVTSDLWPILVLTFARHIFYLNNSTKKVPGV